ncbi:acetyl-CoA carboxylase biotin carboxyl carrier protein subunit [Eisenibacter elegans]|jgi:acetyl/propionyl-CoA carboxylase alpha subunit|uniref:acetyl-CoA carboxylase biotin carboxyl carrier protein subunit n=1 Tax=Eisenibacter elegans TaxID=997 RepID=UPI00041EB286|nr:acetyl-CoA carboxylase biotin carboxyl carrier protein subunit [Eisenibacter elegans]
MLQIDVQDPQGQQLRAQFERKGDQLLLNQTALEWDLVDLGNGLFHILYQGRSYNAQLLRHDREAKTMSLRINGTVHEISLKDKFDLLLQKMGMENAAASKVNEVKAPMPGLILTVHATEGAEVSKGDPLLVLEAMKMENVIKSPSDGIVKNIHVSKGQNVEKNQVLITFA